MCENVFHVSFLVCFKFPFNFPKCNKSPYANIFSFTLNGFFLFFRAEEERSSRMREETITLREELNKLYLSRDLLEQQRIESDGLLTMVKSHSLNFILDLQIIFQSD